MEHKVCSNTEIILHCIWDDRRIERYQPLIDEFQKHDICFRLWPCVVLNDVVASINASHKMIVRWAKESGLKEVAICEDDVYFPAKDGWEYFLRNKPKEYDIYLACTYLPENLVCGFHCYMVSERFFETFLNAPDSVHIDTYFNDVKGDYKFCRPFAALQREGYSSNNRAFSNYNAVLKEEDIYK
jgi:hypothetical protein